MGDRWSKSGERIVSKWMLMVVLMASPLAAHAASESDPLSCEALSAGKGQNDEENIKILARAVPEGSAKHLTDVYRKELIKKGVNDYSAFSASLDYYAKIALPLAEEVTAQFALIAKQEDRKSTRLNSSHSQISYAVFCLKKKKHGTLHCPRLDRR